MKYKRNHTWTITTKDLDALETLITDGFTDSTDESNEMIDYWLAKIQDPGLTFSEFETTRNNPKKPNLRK